jgi:uridine kinase
MIGDILMINENHRKASRQCAELLLPCLEDTRRRYAISIAGESGAGKSEIATALAADLNSLDFRTVIIQQDDYFVLPPYTNAKKREEDIGWVGPREVRLDLLDDHIKRFIRGAKTLKKPLVLFSEDKISSETLNLDGFNIMIVEGTYTTLLKHTHLRIFIDRDYNDSREDRQRRNRETQDDYLETILGIEHGIILRHRQQADIIITRDFRAIKNPFQ